MKVFARLTRTVEDKCVFESTDVQTGNKIAEYSVPMRLSAGVRQFASREKAVAWVQTLNSTHGDGTAVYQGRERFI